MSLKLGPIYLPQEATGHEESETISAGVEMSFVTIVSSFTTILGDALLTFSVLDAVQ